MEQKKFARGNNRREKQLPPTKKWNYIFRIFGFVNKKIKIYTFQSDKNKVPNIRGHKKKY